MKAVKRPRRAPARKKTDADVAAQTRGYLAALPPDVRKIVTGMLKTIRAATPKATEVFSYGIPGFRFDGKPLLWCGAWKAHVSLYPAGPRLLESAGIDATKYETAKGTIRFPLSKPPSAALVRRLTKARLAELALMKR
jgi:uncharacterized protein YdhG (YjbR/CyaY superfamily)